MSDGVATMAAPLARPAYKRILLKISGEALMGPQQFGLHPPDGRAHRRRGRERCTRSASRSPW